MKKMSLLSLSATIAFRALSFFTAALLSLSPISTLAESSVSPNAEKSAKASKGVNWNWNRNLFNWYVQALEARTSPLNAKQEEYFVKRSLELKIYNSLESARNALSGIKGRLAIKMESLEREIGFSKSSSPKLKASDVEGPMKSTIGFTTDSKGAQLPSNSDVIKEPGKVGFTFPTAQNKGGSFLEGLNPAKIEATLKSASAAEKGGGAGGAAKQIASLLLAITVGTAGEALAQEISDQGHRKVEGSANRTKEMMEIALGERLGTAAYDHVIKPAYEAAFSQKTKLVGTK